MANIDLILTLVQQSPGITGLGLHRKLVEQSRTAKWFGKDSTITALFGPGIANLYITLERLERKQLIWSKWGVATTDRGGHRPRHYYAFLGSR